MRVWESVIDPPPQTFREDDAIPQVIPKALTEKRLHGMDLVGRSAAPGKNPAHDR